MSFGYPTGRWAVAPRRPAHEVAYRNSWGEPVGFTVDEPLWQPSAESLTARLALPRAFSWIRSVSALTVSALAGRLGRVP